jgi:hypothetical protein
MSRFLPLALLLVPAGAAAAPPAVTAVAYHPNGSAVAFADGRAVRLFDVATGQARDGVTAPARVTALAFDPRGQRLAVASGEAGKSGHVALSALAPAGPKALADGRAHADAIYAMTFSPDGKTLATAGYDRVIHLWDADAPTPFAAPRLTLKDHSDAVYGLAFHPDGKLLASVSADRAVKVWDAATGKRLYTLGDPTDWVYAVAWSPDKKHLAAAGADRSVRVWAADAAGGKLVGSAFAHDKPVWRLAYSGDGKTLYTVGEDRVIKAWNAAKLTESKVFDAQPDTILDFALRPDGRQVAVARFDGGGVLIDAATGKTTAELLPLKAAPAEKRTADLIPPPRARPVPPKFGKVALVGVARGVPTRIKLTGTDFEFARAAIPNVPDVAAKLVSDGRTATALELEVTAGAGAPLGVAQLVLDGPGGKSAPIALAIDRAPAAPEVGATDSARTAMPIKLPATVVGVLDRAGDADYFRFAAVEGQQIGAQVVAAEVGSKLDAALVLTDDAGAVLAEGAAALGYVVRTPGTYAVGVRDREFRGGPDFHYRLHVGDVPVVTGVFPLAVPRGRTTSVHVTGVNLGAATGASTKVTVPAAAAPGSRVPVPLDGVRAAGSAAVVVSELPSVVLDPATGGDLRVPGSADGIFTKPNEAQTAQFQAKKGDRLVVEVLAQRAGSPVDSVIEILDGAGKPVPLAALRCTAKTNVAFRDHDSRNPAIRLDAWNEFAVDDYLYANGELMRILLLPKGPDEDCRFYEVSGQRAAFLGTTPTHHSQGLPIYKVEVHPPGAKFPPNGMPVFALHCRNDDGGPGYGKDSRLFFTPPADGTYQVRVTDARGAYGPAHAFRVTVRHPKPDFAVRAGVSGATLVKGGSVPVTATVDRLDGFDGAVTVRLKNLPDKFAAPPTTVEAGHESATFPLFAAVDAAPPEKPGVVLVATARIDGKEVAREVTLALPGRLGAGDIVTTLRQESVTIRPGEEARFTVDVARQGGFAGRVPIDVRGLPHGVQVLDVGLNGILITERETSREVVLRAEPWVLPMARPVVVSARREGTNAEYGAKPLVVKVEK